MATDDIHLDNVEDDDDDASVWKCIQKMRKILESDKIDKKREEIEFWG